MATAAQEQLHQPGVNGASAAIRVLHTALVHPYSSGGAPALPETSLPLTFFDVMLLHTGPVQVLYLYRLADDADADAILADLKDSLSHAVRAFYPLAGRLRPTAGTANRYELYYRPGDAVAFTVAEYDGHEFDNLVADEPRLVSRIVPLVPPLPAGGAVLALQATLLPARGLALSISVHHAACDGTTATHFLHTWAAIGSARTLPPPPVIDRTLISDPNGLYDVLIQATTNPDSVKIPDDLLLTTYTLSKDQLQRVKDVVAAEAGTRGVAPPPRCSSLVATLGLVWSSYMRAKPHAAAGGGGDRTCLLLSVDHRSRLKPPLPDKYFGNCVGAALAIASRTELAEAGAGGLLTACTAIAAGIEEAVSGVATETMRKRKEGIQKVFTTMDVLTVAGSPRFRVYDLDLGFGGPAMTHFVSAAKTNAIALADSPSGDGGMEVGVCLLPDGMDAFRKCFAHAVAALELGELSIVNAAQ